MNLTPLQADFSAGEISPLMKERSDLKGYSSSVEKMQNCIATPQGPAFSRFPFELLHVEAGQSFGSVETLQVSADLFYILLFMDYTVKFFTPDGTAVTVGFVTNPRFANLDNGWTEFTDGNAASDVIFTRHFCALAPRANPSGLAGIRQQVTVTDGAAQHKLVIESDVETNVDELIIHIGTSAGASDIYLGITGIDATEILFTPVANTFWIEVINSGAGSDNIVTLEMVDVQDTVADTPIVTPYPQEDTAALYYVENPR